MGYRIKSLSEKLLPAITFTACNMHNWNRYSDITAPLFKLVRIYTVDPRISFMNIKQSTINCRLFMPLLY